MDKKQAHTIGKKINKPVKFVKKNAGVILSGVSTVASLVALYKNKTKR